MYKVNKKNVVSGIFTDFSNYLVGIIMTTSMNFRCGHNFVKEKYIFRGAAPLILTINNLLSRISTWKILEKLGIFPFYIVGSVGGVGLDLFVGWNENPPHRNPEAELSYFLTELLPWFVKFQDLLKSLSSFDVGENSQILYLFHHATKRFQFARRSLIIFWQWKKKLP